MSYALQQRVFACGHQAVTITSGGTGGAVTVNVNGIKKASDTILTTLDINGDTDAAVTLSPYVYSVTDATSFAVDMQGITNNGAGSITVFLNWAVLR